MRLRHQEISIVRHSAAALCLDEVERFAAVAAGNPFAILETPHTALLFEKSQVSLLAEVAARIESLRDSIISASKCPHMLPLKHADSNPLILTLNSFRDFKCKPRLTCGRCAFRKCSPLKLASPDRFDPSSLTAAIKPLRVPQGIACRGTLLYRIGSSALFAFESNGGRLLLPLPQYPVAESNVSMVAFMKSVRAYERKSLKVPFSLRLSSIIDERSAFARSSGLIERLIPLAAYSSVGLGRAFPLLIDGLITEIFVDSEGSFAYVDHRELGRCNTGVHISKDELGRLINFAKAEAERCLDYTHPSLRASIKTLEFHVRVSVDTPPLSIEGTAVAIRKFCIKPLTMSDLLSNGTLTPEAALYLEDCVKRRRSITIYGESGSGKTTLAVALDLLTPPSWRKISVESDVAENVSQGQFSKHQIRLLASGSSKVEQEKRTSILNSLLHKSPDYIFFGEVLSVEDSAALFQMLASGLKCIHTIHSESAEALLRRLVLQHRIPPESIMDLELLVQLQKVCEGERIFRRVIRISEISKSCHDGSLPLIIDLFRWSGTRKCLEQSHEPWMAPRASACPIDASLNGLR